MTDSSDDTTRATCGVNIISKAIPAVIFHAFEIMHGEITLGACCDARERERAIDIDIVGI